MWKTVTALVVIIVGIVWGVAHVNAEPVSHPTQTEPWTHKQINDLVDDTNFIVSGGCSGTLISLDKRLVLTNYHCIDEHVKQRKKEVVRNGEIVEIRVEETRDVPLKQKFYTDYRNVGSTTYQSVIIAKKEEYDLALLQIRAENIKSDAASQVLPKNRKPVRGESVWVVGNPRGLDASLTRGVISSMTRMFRARWADNQELPFIQTDAAVSPGNSGGALYDSRGYLIGIPTARIGDSTLGLAIPYTIIRKFLSESCFEQVWKKDGESRESCQADDKK